MHSKFSRVLLLATFILGHPGASALFHRNENHIFNAIHASLRQWDSSYHHNGMSFFLASIPADTKLYHSEFSNASITGLKWLGFEPQLPIDCLRGSLVPGGPPPDVRPPGWDDNDALVDVGQLPLVVPHVLDPHENELAGANKVHTPYLHTYRTTRDLRMLYIDGQSASKTLNGTLDSTDRILLNDLLSEDPINADRERAAALCDLWPTDAIDGFVRMQEGFEVILCEAERVLELRSVLQTDGYDKLQYTGEALWQSVFADVRPDVLLDYDSVITGYSPKYSIDLFKPRRPDLPRLTGMTSSQRTAVMRDLDALITSDKLVRPHVTDWQRVASNVVAHFATELVRLVDTPWETKGKLNDKIDHFLRPHVDVRYNDRTADVDRCAKMYLPSAHRTSIASTAIEAVSSTVCQELFCVRDEPVLEIAIQRIRSLIQILGWSAFKYCRDCKLNEVCFIPQWFLGGVGDRDSPRCRNFSDYSQRTDYWGNLGRKRT